jgi:hypothetical protein
MLKVKTKEENKMSNTFSWRPKEYSVPELQKFAKLHNTNLNRLIEESVNERIHKIELAEKGDVADLLTFEISKVVTSFMGTRLGKPDQGTHEKIMAKVRETDKKDAWVSSGIEKKYSIGRDDLKRTVVVKSTIRKK